MKISMLALFSTLLATILNAKDNISKDKKEALSASLTKLDKANQAYVKTSNVMSLFDEPNYLDDKDYKYIRQQITTFGFPQNLRVNLIDLGFNFSVKNQKATIGLEQIFSKKITINSIEFSIPDLDFSKSIKTNIVEIEKELISQGFLESFAQSPEYSYKNILFLLDSLFFPQALAMSKTSNGGGFFQSIKSAGSYTLGGIKSFLFPSNSQYLKMANKHEIWNPNANGGKGAMMLGTGPRMGGGARDWETYVNEQQQKH